MCGLYGLVAEVNHGFTNLNMEVIVASAWINQWRGQHSSGMVNINNKGGYRYIKEVGGIGALTASKSWESFRTEALNKGQIFYGHGRYATRGEVTVANAHPFAIGGDDDTLVFMHNGTLSEYQQLPGLKKYKVDSEWLGNMIYEHGVEHALSHMSGAIACMWYDLGTQKFHVYRNHDRPLFVVQYGGPQSQRRLINSEIAALMWLQEKFVLPFKREDIREFEARSLYSIEAFNVKAGWTKTLIAPKYDLWKPKGAETYSGRGVPQLPLAPKTYETVRKVSYPANSEDSRLTERNYTQDVLMILKGLVLRVEFATSGGVMCRWTHWDGGSVTRDECAPYENGLTKLEKIDHTTIRKWWVNGNQTPYSSDVRFNPEMLESMIRETESPSKVHVNKPVTWESKKGSVKVLHKATLLKYFNNVPFYETYENDLDGIITLGDTVQVEVADVEQQTDSTLFRAICLRLKPKQDACITYTFCKSRWSDHELYRIGNFEGKIASIRRMEKKHGWDSNDVMVGLSKVHPMYDGKTADEEAVVEIPINTEAANDK